MKKQLQILSLLLILLLASNNMTAEIIYTDVDPDVTPTDPFMGKYFIDFDNNGTDDYEIRNFDTGDEMRGVELYVKDKNQVLVEGDDPENKPLAFDNSFALDLSSGKWFNHKYKMSRLDNFANEGEKYLGLYFKSQDGWHYGWARISVVLEEEDLYFTIMDFAYESEPDKAISTGDNGGTGINDYQASFDFSNSPNPFSDGTTIRYTLTQSDFVEINIYDSIGNKVSTLNEGQKDIGPHSCLFSSKDLTAGVYYYTIQLGQNVESGKMLLVK